MQRHVEAVLVAEGRCPGSQMGDLLLAVKGRLQPYWLAAAAAVTAVTPQPLSRLCLSRIRTAVGVKRLAKAAADNTSTSSFGLRRGSGADGRRLHEQLRLPSRMEDYLTLTRLPETMTTETMMMMISSMPKKRMMMMNQKTDATTTTMTTEQREPSAMESASRKHPSGGGDAESSDPLGRRIRQLLENSSKSV
jgi:hypothetical protein